MYNFSQCNNVAVVERVDAMDESYTALWCGCVRFDSLPATLATEGWKWELKVHDQGEVDSNRWNRCRLLDRAITASRF